MDPAGNSPESLQDFIDVIVNYGFGGPRPNSYAGDTCRYNATQILVVVHERQGDYGSNLISKSYGGDSYEHYTGSGIFIYNFADGQTEYFIMNNSNKAHINSLMYGIDSNLNKGSGVAGTAKKVFGGISLATGGVAAYSGLIAAGLAVPTLGMSVPTAGTVCAVAGTVSVISGGIVWIIEIFE